MRRYLHRLVDIPCQLHAQQTEVGTGDIVGDPAQDAAPTEVISIDHRPPERLLHVE